MVLCLCESIVLQHQVCGFFSNVPVPIESTIFRQALLLFSSNCITPRRRLNARYASCRYKPDIAKAVAGFAKADADLAADVDGKVAIECLEPSALTSNAPHQPLGSAAARQKVLEAHGYKVSKRVRWTGAASANGWTRS